MEIELGLVSPGDKTLFEDDHSENKCEDTVGVPSKPSVDICDSSPPALPSPDSILKPPFTLLGLGPSKVSCFILNFSPMFFSYFILLILLMKRILGRNGSPQDHKRKQCHTGREVIGLRFIKVGGSEQFLGMPLWKERITEQLERTAIDGI